MPTSYDQWGNRFYESYGEVDDDKPYMPADLDWQGYNTEKYGYEQFLNDRRRELESTGGEGAAAMRTGLNQAQLAMQAQATGRGANPGNERAALYAGSQMQRQGALQGAQMTQAEYSQLAAMEDAYRRQNVQNAISQQAMEMQRQQMMSNNYNAAVGADIQQTNSDWSNYSGIVGTVVGAAAGAASDVRVKEGIEGATPEQQDQLMRAADLYRYDYRPEYQGHAAEMAGIPPEIKQRRQTGVMAQDLASTPLGESMVYEDPQTGMLAIDGGQAVTTSLGLIGRLGERADELDRRLAELEAQRQAAGKGKRRA